MNRENYINSLRMELVGMVADHLTPVALKYGYSEVPLETNIKWRPQVLVIGNYSSGKSTLINEFLGANIQATGQAPTDDSFTILTYDDSTPEGSPIHVTEERDGKFLLNDPEYPFEILKKHGQRFASHFRLKKINAPFLKNLAIIDTPGMLDSITERDRGYDYQEVVGDLAQLVDLVLVLFDPHKAGTVREAHKSLRETLPSKTFEDRVLYILNRIDECSSLTDLLRVYGTLCWNLSQITGRKDIPMIHLTYSPNASPGIVNGDNCETGFLHSLQNQREEIRKAIQQTPQRHLDHLATFVETHSERLAHLLEALINYRKKLRGFKIKFGAAGILISLIVGAVSGLGLAMVPFIAGQGPLVLLAIGGVIAAGAMVGWFTFIQQLFRTSFHRKQINQIDELTPLENQTRRDVWEAVRKYVLSFLERTKGTFSLKDIKQEYTAVRQIYDEGAREIREALSELSTIRNESPSDNEDIV
ncbi:MAG: dynamin family protein [Desulfobacterales bacterium]|nr:dynamin family protein [Desulfobacterales bacterium]